MTDLHIKITDENGTLLQHINVYEDGSDGEYAGEIARELLEAYDGARDVYEPEGKCDECGSAYDDNDPALKLCKTCSDWTVEIQTYRVFCEVYGGVTGYRCAYMKKNGEEMVFASREAAELAATNAMRQMNGPNAVARFKYTVEAP